MNAHTRDCWAHAYSCARQNGADSVEAFDWAAMWLDPASGAGMDICRCAETPRATLLDRRGFAFTRS